MILFSRPPSIQVQVIDSVLVRWLWTRSIDINVVQTVDIILVLNLVTIACIWLCRSIETIVGQCSQLCKDELLGTRFS